VTSSRAAAYNELFCCTMGLSMPVEGEPGILVLTLMIRLTYLLRSTSSCESRDATGRVNSPDFVQPYPFRLSNSTVGGRRSDFWQRLWSAGRAAQLRCICHNSSLLESAVLWHEETTHGPSAEVGRNQQIVLQQDPQRYWFGLRAMCRPLGAGKHHRLFGAGEIRSVGPLINSQRWINHPRAMWLMSKFQSLEHPPSLVKVLELSRNLELISSSGYSPCWHGNKFLSGV
jgi:hypothetical protein